MGTKNTGFNGGLYINTTKKTENMKTEQQNKEPDYRKYLPIYGAVKNNKKVDWIVFGTLTSSVPRSPKTLIKIFKSIIHQIGLLNNSYERRLHYIARCEKHLSDEWHIHFLLGGHKIVDGKNSSISINECCEYLEKLWNDYGIAEVDEYNRDKGGLEYILKKRNADEHDDDVIVSSAIMTMLKNDKFEQDEIKDENELIEYVMNAMNINGKVVQRVSEISEENTNKKQNS